MKTYIYYRQFQTCKSGTAPFLNEPLNGYVGNWPRINIDDTFYGQTNRLDHTFINYYAADESYQQQSISHSRPIHKQTDGEIPVISGLQFLQPLPIISNCCKETRKLYVTLTHNFLKLVKLETSPQRQSVYMILYLSINRG